MAKKIAGTNATATKVTPKGYLVTVDGVEIGFIQKGTKTTTTQPTQVFGLLQADGLRSQVGLVWPKGTPLEALALSTWPVEAVGDLGTAVEILVEAQA